MCSAGKVSVDSTCSSRKVSVEGRWLILKLHVKIRQHEILHLYSYVAAYIVVYEQFLY